MKRYPLGPLLALPGWSMERVRAVAPCNGSEYRIRKERGVTEATADRLATAAGYHPSEIWPEWLNDSIKAAQRACAADDCETRFIPTNRRQRFCQARCRQRIWGRRRRSTPEGRAANRAYAAAYAAAHPEYVRARQRRYYHANAEQERERARRNRARAREATQQQGEAA